MSAKSNLDVAFDLLLSRQEAVSFKEIWEEVCRVQGYDDAYASHLIGQFYTNLSVDGRFVTLGENVWDLRLRHTFDKVHIDMNEVYHDVEAESDEDGDEEEAEYNSILKDDMDDEENDADENEEMDENVDDLDEESDY